LPFRLFAHCALLALTLCSAPAHSQERGEGHPRPAARDTSAFFPVWLHPWFELGGDWLSGPQYMRGAYESGQAFGVGLSVRPLHRLELRTAFDFQTLQTNQSGKIVYIWGYDAQNQPLADTVSYQSTGRSWSWTLRPEVGLMTLPDVWLTGGVGAGYMNGGFQDGLASLGPPANLPQAMHNGWGWLWTAAARWDIEPDPILPLGFDVRTTGLKRGSDFIQTWAVRVTYRVPNPARFRR
jgi:hypothetical protein